MDTNIIFTIAVLIFSVVIHEVAHGAVANALGDPTARLQGRLTLNPLAHLDWVGSFLVPVLLYLTAGFAFGWAKPVPYNPYNLRNQRWGPALVAAAGPLTNLAVAALFSLLIRGTLNPLIKFAFLNIIMVNVTLAVFNLFPIPPLDGSQVLLNTLPHRLEVRARQFFDQTGLLLVIIFIFFGWPLVSIMVNWVLRLFGL